MRSGIIFSIRSRACSPLVAIRISTFAEWFEKKIHPNVRNKIRKADKQGIKVRIEPFNNRLVLGIMDIYNESQVRQGRRFTYFGKDFERTYEEAKEKVRLRRGLPGDFYGLDNDRIQVNYYDEEVQKSVSGDFDLVILSVGMAPTQSHGFFSDALGISLDEDGFLSEPKEGAGMGIIVAGSAKGPMDVSESISHAKKAALEMGRYLKGIA